jgi:hypothetical protein
MMDFIKENKMFAGIIIAVIVLVGGYFAYTSGSSSDTLLTSTADTPTAQVSKELLATLGNLRSLSLDTSIFTDAAFVSLVDFGTAIPLEPVGRENPFAPLSGLGTRASSSGTNGIPTRIVPVGKNTK